MKEWKLLIDGKWQAGGAGEREVHAPYDGRAVARVAQASAEQVEQALRVASAGRSRLAALSTGERRGLLHRVIEGLKARQPELIEAIRDESGKPLKAAQVEMRRALETFTLAAAELTSFGGRTVPIDLDPGSAGYECETRRFPAGVVVGIVPFNFPLNLGAHKAAPALAVGAPIIIKPPPQAPSAQLILGEIAIAAGADPAALQVVPCDNALAERLATDPRVRIVSFTGSARVGWSLKAKAPGKAILELGGNAAVVICEDADLAWAAQRCALGGFNHAGQSCIKVQRVLVEEQVYPTFVDLLVKETQKLKIGDPASDQTVVGPVIDDASAQRIEEWIAEAVRGGARVLTGGKREGRMIEATVLADVPRAAKIFREEVFGPVVIIDKVKSFDEALDAVNDTAYGLQAGVFTRDLGRTREAFHKLEVGGVVINDYPTFRSDNYPYGGVKASGLGREGARSAMEELTEERVLVTRHA